MASVNEQVSPFSARCNQTLRPISTIGDVTFKSFVREHFLRFSQLCTFFFDFNVIYSWTIKQTFIFRLSYSYFNVIYSQTIKQTNTINKEVLQTNLCKIILTNDKNLKFDIKTWKLQLQKATSDCVPLVSRIPNLMEITNFISQ